MLDIIIKILYNNIRKMKGRTLKTSVRNGG